MAKPTPALIDAIRKTARKLQTSTAYQWGHMGSCNCGHLVQEITKLSRAQIHDYAMRTRGGDWSEQALDYCPTSGYLMDQVISIMLDAGMDLPDFEHLEKLSDKRVLNRLPYELRHLRYNNLADVVTYMNTWADLLQEELIQHVKLPSIKDYEAVL